MKTEPEMEMPTENTLRREALDALLARAAELGAARCLTRLGLENGHAARDIRELRGARP
jgi:hypothetical protein